MENYLEYEIGGHNLVLPSDHLAPKYKQKWRRYDTALGYIAGIVFNKYPQSTAIDIGANVGDSAALIQQNQPIPTLCIEGNPEFWPFLEHNAATIGNITIMDCFVGEDGTQVALEQIDSHSGTTSINQAIGQAGILTTQMQSLATIIQQRPAFSRAKLVKIDTDGCDFQIINTSINWLQATQPVLFFEYDIFLNDAGPATSIKTMHNLSQAGYQRFIVYDNFGNYLASVKADDFDLLYDLNSYQYSNRRISGTPAVYYYDICAFPAADIDLFTELREFEIRPVALTDPATPEAVALSI